MATITLTHITFSTTPGVNQVVNISWRKLADADIPANYTAGPDATINPSGNIISPTPYTLTVPETSIVIKVVSNCDITGHQKTFINCEPVSLTGSMKLSCAAGYTLSDDGTYCYKIDTQAAANSGGSPTLMCHFQYSQYSQWGTIFYREDEFTNTGVITTRPDDSFVSADCPIRGVVGGSSPSSLFWVNQNDEPSSAPNDDTYQIEHGRLNRTGVWKCGAQTQTGEFGFSRQIIVPETKLYYIGVGGDDTVKIDVNGEQFVYQNLSAINSSFNTVYSAVAGGSVLVGTIADLYRYWHVYPVRLTAGPNLIKITGNNTGSLGLIGCEIYNATIPQLKSVTSEAQLKPYLLFSSAPTTSATAATPFGQVNDNTPSDIGYWNCTAHPGYTLVYNSTTSTYECQKKMTQSPT